MKRKPPFSNAAPMSADAYAGFLKLWLTPSSEVPAMTDDIVAYLRHSNVREPVQCATRPVGRKATKRAA